MASGLTFSLGSARPPSTSSHGDRSAGNTQKSGSKRSRAALDDDSDDDGMPAKQAVTHFGANGASNAAAKPVKAKAPLVIQAQSNRDWRDASKAAQAQKRARHGLPAQDAATDAQSREAELKRLEDSRKPTFGLNVKAKDEQKGPSGADESAEQPRDLDSNPKSQRTRTDDEIALDALLGIAPQTNLTIPAVTEEEAFQRDYHDAPPMATLEQYAAVPVEEFGAALLRGMGWKEGHGIGKQSGQKIQKFKVPERRAALLGIGAKEDAGTREELGAWGRGTKKGRPDQVYNPVIMRNKRTGEEVTEEEMQAKMEEQKMKDKDAELDRDRARRKDQERKERKSKERRSRDDYSDDEYERRRREKRRERERDGDRKDDSRRRKRDDSRDYSDRRREKDRTRDEERYASSRRDRNDRDRYDRRGRDDDYDRRRRH